MTSCGSFVRSIVRQTTLLAVAALVALAPAVAVADTSGGVRVLRGTVESNGSGLPGYQVALYEAIAGGHGGSAWQLLGSAGTDFSGRFSLVYPPPDRRPGRPQPILFVEATHGPVMLASAIAEAGRVPPRIVVNERTTVATANAFAQFIHGSTIEGNTHGMINAVRMAANLAEPGTGGVGLVLNASPNRTETSTLATFNSLANAVASCVAVADDCTKLFAAATPAGQPAPTSVLQALANIVRNPSYVQPDGRLAADDPLFDLSTERAIYHPALARRPTGWLLFLTFTGGFYSAQDADNLINGPANFAIDARGFAWIGGNYIPQPPSHFACAGDRLIKFDPSGANAPGSPYFGGGLSGAGYGAAIDPRGDVWTANFGFQDPPCTVLPQAAEHDSVSVFRPDGSALSPPEGIIEGGISWPQGLLADRHGNIWVANCGNDSLTMIPDGKPYRAFNIPLGPVPARNRPQIKPFGIAFDLDGNVWVTDNISNTVSVVSPRGKLIDTLPGTFDGQTVISHPIGDAADSRGDIWVANSDWLDVPCPTRRNLGQAGNPSITMYQMGSHRPYGGASFTGGGLTIPWGIAVDGNDTVWVFNFGVVPPGKTTRIETGISHFCGIDTSKCPPGMHVGAAISPRTGYRSDALERITAGEIDPSGNIWITSNWKTDANPFKNPGGNSVVIAVGAAVPLQTPLIGTPVPFN